jgi:stage V sporulation protein G
MTELSVSEIQIVPVKAQNGLVAFASAVINNQFYLGNIAIYSAPSSKEGFRLVFPNKKLASGRVVDCFHPISKAAGDLVTAEIVFHYKELMTNFYNIEAV